MGVGKSTPEERENARRYHGVLPCDYRFMLLASKDGDLPRLTRSLFSLVPSETVDGYDDTPMHHAAARGHLDCCKLMLKVDRACVVAINKAKNTPCAQPGSRQTRCDRAAPCSLAALSSPSCLRRLHLSASTAKPDVVELLLGAGAAVDARGYGQFTPLHYACRDIPKVGRSCTVTPEELAEAVEASVAVVTMLLANGANPEARTADGAMPLDLAWCDEIRALLPRAHVAATRGQYERRLSVLLGLQVETPAEAEGAEGDETARVVDDVIDDLLPELPPKLLCPITHGPEPRTAHGSPCAPRAPRTADIAGHGVCGAGTAR